MKKRDADTYGNLTTMNELETKLIDILVDWDMPPRPGAIKEIMTACEAQLLELIEVIEKYDTPHMKQAVLRYLRSKISGK